jgi:hypothetical protein
MGVESRRSGRAVLKLRGRQHGAAVVEFHVVTLLAMLPLGLGLLQSAFLVTENHHVDHAAFMAARAGATANGQLESMRREFARVMTPLFVNSERPVDGSNVAGRVLDAYGRSRLDFMAYGSVRVLSPDADAQADFAEQRQGMRVIPNDSLEHRGFAPGTRSGMSIQQANVLRVEFTYCRPLIVPFVRQMLIGLLRRLDLSAGHQRCYIAGRIPVVSIGTAPMQSDFRIQ